MRSHDPLGDNAPLGAIVFFSSLIRAVFGFGNALVAMPLLAFFLDMGLVTPYVALVSGALTIYLFIQERQNVDFRSATPLVISSLLGIPLGILFLKGDYNTTLKVILGLIIISYSSFCLIVSRTPYLEGQRLSYLFGFVAGILGGAFNTNGPPVVIYGSLKGWRKERFRATLQAYFLATSVMVIFFHGVSGLWTKELLRLAVFSVPLVFAAVFAGNRLINAIPQRSFETCIHWLLILCGGVLVLREVFF